MRWKIITLAVAIAAAAVAAPSALAADDRGDLTVEWAALKGKDRGNGTFQKANRQAARALRRSGVVEAVVDEVNRRWALPRDVPVLFSDAVEDGPFYVSKVEIGDTTTPLINFPGQFLTWQVDALRPYLRGIKGVSAKDGMIAGTAFVLAHEIGHALVSQLDIPITGKEEDAVDGFAAYLLTDNPRFGPGAALAAAMVFDATTSDDAPPSPSEYADEHSLGAQRKYQFLCWIYGSDRTTFKGIVGKGGLPRRRAVRCGSEWKQVTSSWTRLLEPHAKAR